MRIHLDRFPGGKMKALTMSYDDGKVQDRRLVQIFNQYGIRGSFHLNSGSLGKGGYLEASEIRELFADHEVSAHSVTHPYLTHISNETLVSEIMEDRRNLEAWVGYPVRGMSYPFGAWNDVVLARLPAFGIEYARTTKSHQGFHLPEHFLAWSPTCHHNDNLLEIGRKFLDEKRSGIPQLMYVWGHSYEFDNDQNWDLITTFCERIGNQDAVWYATNIEIVSYVQAVKRLVFSASEHLVSNPSAISVWISVEGQPIEIRAGETKTLT